MYVFCRRAFDWNIQWGWGLVFGFYASQIKRIFLNFSIHFLHTSKTSFRCKTSAKVAVFIFNMLDVFSWRHENAHFLNHPQALDTIYSTKFLWYVFWYAFPILWRHWLLRIYATVYREGGNHHKTGVPMTSDYGFGSSWCRTVVAIEML